MKMLFGALFGVMFCSSQSFAFCMEPTPPFGGVPDAPYCVDNVCESWDADSYKREIEDYLRDVKRYAEEAIDYAGCESNEATRNWNDFAANNRVKR